MTKAKAKKQKSTRVQEEQPSEFLREWIAWLLCSAAVTSDALVSRYADVLAEYDWSSICVATLGDLQSKDRELFDAAALNKIARAVGASPHEEGSFWPILRLFLYGLDEPAAGALELFNRVWEQGDQSKTYLLGYLSMTDWVNFHALHLACEKKWAQGAI